MTMQKLVKTWALPDRTQDRQQLTLRLNYDLYAKLHALKEVYKNRSVNDMINDILGAGLDEIIEALPQHRVIDASELSYIADVNHCSIDDLGPVYEGPRVNFDSEYRRILELKSSDEITQERAA